MQRLGAVLREKHRGQRGTQLLELALILPLLVLLVFIVLEGGELARVHTVLNNAGREGARLAVQPRNECPGCVPYTAVMNSANCTAVNLPYATDKFHDVVAAMCQYIKIEDAARPSGYQIATGNVTVTITESAVPNGLPNGQMRVYTINVSYPYTYLYLHNFMPWQPVLQSHTTFRELGTT